MFRRVIVRLLWAVPVLFIVTMGTFLLLELAPGDAAQTLAGEDATPEEVEEIREKLGLNQPVWWRYLLFIGNALQGDFGSSLSNSKPVLMTILECLPVTLSLLVLVLLTSVVVAVPLGVLAALRANRFLDRAIVVFTSVGLAVPSFLLALLLVVVFTFQLDLLPPTGFVPLERDPGKWLLHLILPVAALASTPIAELARMTRGSMRDALEQDYLRTAWAKGMLGRQVVIKHALRNAVIPIVTTVGLQAARIVGGTLIIERVFNIPGLGALTINAVIAQDATMLMGIVLFIALAVVLINLLVDISYIWLNPRLRA